MSVRVRIDCPECTSPVTAEPDGTGDGETLHGRTVTCGDCGHPIEVYYY